MSSYSRMVDTLSAPIDSLTESQFSDRVVMEIIKTINKERRESGAQPLHMDEYCNNAAAEIASKISQLGTAITSCKVVGTDFSMVNSEKNHTLPTSPQINETLLSAYISQLSMLDMSSHRSLVNPQYTHCGFAVKRMYDMLKIHGVLFKKLLCVFHVNFEVSDGIKIRGKMLDRGYALCCVLVRDAVQESSKGTVVGPSRMKFNHDTLEFEVNIPRLVLSSRAVTDKELEFYVTADNTKTINYGKMPDIRDVQTGASIAHKMTFNGLWEANVMIEERPLSDSQFIKEEHDSKNSSQLMEFDMGAQRRGAASRGRATGLRSRGGASARTGQWGVPSRDTPFKTGHLGLSRRTGGTQPASSWGPAQDHPYGENVPPIDVEMAGTVPDPQPQVRF